MNFCSECGNKIEQTWKNCPFCGCKLGSSLQDSVVVRSEVSQIGSQSGKELKIDGSVIQRSVINQIGAMNVQGMNEEQFKVVSEQLAQILEKLGNSEESKFVS